MIYRVVETGYKSNSLGSFLMGQLNDISLYMYMQTINTSNGHAFIEIKCTIFPLLTRQKYLGYRVEIFHLIFLKMVLFLGNWSLNWCDVRHNDNDVNGASST